MFRATTMRKEVKVKSATGTFCKLVFVIYFFFIVVLIKLINKNI